MAPPQASLARALDDRDNALNLIRLVLATSVIVSHTPLVLGRTWWLDDGALGWWAVSGFFAISGFLVTRSRERSDLRSYLWRRSLRLFPGLWGALLVTAFVLAPLAAWAVEENWAPTSAARYVGANSLLAQFQWGIDQTLTAAPFPLRWNVPLWTVLYEFLAYLLVGYMFAIPRSRSWAPFAVGAALGASMLHLNLASAAPDALRLLACFFAGSLVYLLRDRVPLNRWWAGACVGVVVVSAALGSDDRTSQVAIAYLLLYLGAVLPVRLGATNDISYGMYIYGFPVQQTLVAIGGTALAAATFSAVAVALTLPLALASWHLIERRALEARGRIPAHGWDPHSRRVHTSADPS